MGSGFDLIRRKDRTEYLLSVLGFVSLDPYGKSCGN